MPDDNVPVARPFWSGTISFGLVSIPVDLLSASRSPGVAMHLVDSRDGELLKREYVCPEHGKALSAEQTARGYELDDGSFVTISDEELEAIAPDKSRDIDLTRFVPASEIDPLYFQRTYFLAPSGRSSKAYHLLTQTMEHSGRAGLGTFVMRGKEHLVAIFAEGGVLRAATLRFADELRTMQDIGVSEAKPQLKLVHSLIRDIRKLSRAELDTTVLEDPYPDELRSLAERKLKNDEDVIEPTTSVDEVSPRENVIDLLEELKKRVGVPRGRSGTRPGLRQARARRSPARAPRKASSRKRSGSKLRSVESSRSRSHRSRGQAAARSV